MERQTALKNAYKAVVLILFFIIPFSGLVNAQAEILLNASIEIPPDYKAVRAGDPVQYNIQITDLSGSGKLSGVLISTSLINSETGKKEAFAQKTVTVETLLSLSDILLAPRDLKAGAYKLQVAVEYSSQVVADEDTLYLIDPDAQEDSPQIYTGYLTIVLLLLAVILVMMVLLELKHR
ncbi:MAG: hypothetical protein HYW25_00190 [Candidatus Aenigmarchaeota archaeon]|nr:hypothetical protein [Candidatus Aenigmarchaeota archaeon]